MLAFSLLGSFRIETDEGPLITALPRRCVSLLGYVLLHRPERIYRERLAAALWPDVGDTEARGKLRRHLYLIGQAVPQAKRDDWFISDTTTIGWNPAVVATTDIELLREAVRAERWETAVRHYRGELLTECDDEWLIDERERFRDLHVTSLERLALAERAAGSFTAAIAAARELLRLEPWREAVVRVLMEARYAIGDRAGALADYERFSARLRDDLDVEPMPETTALYADMIRRTASVTLAAPAPAATVRTPGAMPFVGRDAQLETLREAWSRARQRRGGLAFVGGESGVGKTRLVEELATHAAVSGGAVLRGGTTFIETGPYQALVEALRSATSLADVASGAPWRPALATMLPELHRAAADVPALLGPEAERSRLFEAVVAALASLATARPLLVVLEDLHWAGSGTVALLAHVARRVVHEPIAIVATYRDDDLPRAHPLRDLRRQLGREGTACVVSLGPLTARDVERFFALRFGDAAPPALAARYHAATEGLPLFLVEILAEVTNDRTLPVVPATDLPQSLAATIERRLHDLSPAGRAAMEIAAVIGAGFDLELVAEASGWSDAETVRNVGDLIERHLVRELPGSGAGYAFAHAFYRENAYARIPPAKRRERHAHVARALAELYPGRLLELAPELARHYEEAGDRARAILHLGASARRASGLLANEDVLAYAERALALEPTPASELELRLLREEAFRRSGQRPGQRIELERASALSQKLGDRDAEFEVIHRRIALAHAMGERELERTEIVRAAELGERPGSAWLAKLALARGKHYSRMSAHRAARENLELAARRFEAVRDARGAFESYLGLAEVERICQSLEAVERCFEAAERQLSGCDDSRALVMRLYEERANFAFFRQRYTEAEAWSQRFCEAAEATGDVASRARAYMLLGSAAAWCFDIARARSHLAQAAQLFDAIGDRHHVYAVGYEFGLLAVWLGDLDEAILRFTRANSEAEALGYAYGRAACSISLGHACSLAGDAARAEDQARRAIELAKSLDAESLLAPGLVNLGIALVQGGRLHDAEAPLVEGCRLGESAGRADLVAEASSFLACVYAGTGRSEAALAAANEMLRLMDTISPTLRSGGRYWTVSQALARAGHPAEAAAALAQGREVVRAQLERIPDEVSRQTFGSLPAHRALLDGAHELASADAYRTVLA
jgi:DNA-binding SARP family transcriptional activator